MLGRGEKSVAVKWIRSTLPCCPCAPVLAS